MEKEFNLSKTKTYIVKIGKYDKDFIETKNIRDVKEFIKETEADMRNSKLSRMGMIEKFKKRAGDKLI